MEVLSAVRSFFPINLKCGISMSLLVISVIHTNTTLKAPRVLLMGKNMLGHLLVLLLAKHSALPIYPMIISNKFQRVAPIVESSYPSITQSRTQRVNWTTTLELQVLLRYHRVQYALNNTWSSNVVVQLTHSMLPLSLLILGCYTCSIYRWPLDSYLIPIDGTSIATYQRLISNMSRDNGNIECTSNDDWYSIMMIINFNEDSSNNTDPIMSNNERYDMSFDVSATIQWDNNSVAEDLYSHQYGLWSEPIKTISNTKNIIIPLINGTGILMPVMIIFCIRDSLREYKSNYVILSSMKLSIYNWCILSESTIFNLLFWLSYQHILSPIYITNNLWTVLIQMNSYDLSLKTTNLLSNSGILFGHHYIIGTWLELNQWYQCSWMFMNGQSNEFTNLAINMNDTLIGWNFYNIDGLHLYHIVVGNILLIIGFNLSSWTQYVLYKVMFQLRVRLHHMFYNIQLVYWHFVELLWLVIYYLQYS